MCYENLEKNLATTKSCRLLALSANSSEEILERNKSNNPLWVDSSRSKDSRVPKPRPPRSDSDKDNDIRSDEDYWEDIEPRMSL